MKLSAATCILLLLLGVVLVLGSGCASNDPDNAAVRPWNAPQGWENGLGSMDTQHE